MKKKAFQTDVYGYAEMQLSGKKIKISATIPIFGVDVAANLNAEYHTEADASEIFSKMSKKGITHILDQQAALFEKDAVKNAQSIP
jgi:uncharacterized glyoxalase superfamily protein PhnB